MIRVLVADDHGLIRRGIRQILSETEDLRAAGEAATGAEAIQKVRSGGYDVVLLDISMPGRSGLDAIHEILASCPGIKVIVVSMHSEDQYAVRSLREGASAYITKTSADAELVAAIRQVAEGKRYITSEVAERLASYVEQSGDLSPHERLSSREFQIMVKIGSGKTTGEIAEELSLSVKTVSTYRSRILAKTGMKTNAQLIKYAVEHRLGS